MERHGNMRLGRLVAGLILIGVGLLLALDRLWIVDFGDVYRLWPLIVILVGLSRLSAGGERRQSGLVITMVGIWLLINTLGLFGLDWSDSWPLVLILIGLARILVPCGEGRGGGVLMLLIGCWALINVLELWGLTWQTSWSIPIIIVGLFIVWRALSGEREERGRRSKEVSDHGEA